MQSRQYGFGERDLLAGQLYPCDGNVAEVESSLVA